MAKQPIAVNGCTVKITSGQSAVSIQITTPPLDDCSISGKGIYFGDIDVSLTTITQGNLLCASGTITISGTADNILNANGDKAVLKGDNATKSLTFTDQSSGTQTPINVKIEITDAGQTDVSAL